MPPLRGSGGERLPVLSPNGAAVNSQGCQPLDAAARPARNIRQTPAAVVSRRLFSCSPRCTATATKLAHSPHSSTLRKNETGGGWLRPLDNSLSLILLLFLLLLFLLLAPLAELALEALQLVLQVAVAEAAEVAAELLELLLRQVAVVVGVQPVEEAVGQAAELVAQRL